MIIKNNMLLFWGGIFSQWFRANITIDGITFNCNEQYMMYKKALLFGDYDVAKKVLKISDPKEQKKLGREVKNFNKNTWEAVCKDIVFRANWAKFTQNEDLYTDLMSYDENVIFVEASPKDKIWGIGLGENDPRAADKSQWLGTNWLGEAITNVRDSLIIKE